MLSVDTRGFQHPGSLVGRLRSTQDRCAPSSRGAAASALVGLLVVALSGQAAQSQDPTGVVRRGVPTRVPLGPTNPPSNWMTSIGGGGQMTPDGRLVLRGFAYGWTWGGPDQNGWPPPTGPSNGVNPGWAVQVVRPEAITRDPITYQPVFTAAAFSPVGEGYLVEPGLDPTSPASIYGVQFIQNPTFLPPGRSTSTFPGIVTSGVQSKAHTTWIPDPQLDLTPNNEVPATNPYACDAQGVPLSGLPSPFTAQYVAYEMLSLTSSEDYDLASGAVPLPEIPATARLRQVPMKVVVANPYTANASVAKAWVTGRFQDLEWFDVASSQHKKLYLAEQSITQNGHFLVAHGKRPATFSGGVNRFPTSFEFGSVIWATWNPTPGSIQGWREPVLLSEVYAHRNDTLKVVNGVNIPLQDMVRLARQPMRYQNGDLVGNIVVDQAGGYVTNWDATLGAYPWLHWDGDGVMYPIGGSRGTMAYCGVQTRHTFSSLDAANFSHLLQIAGEEHDKNNEAHIMSGLMAMSGVWDVYRRTGRLNGEAVLDAHPAHPREPVFAFIHGANHPQRLTTMAFDDWCDGEYMTFLHMTPVVARMNRIATWPLSNLWTRHELDRTTDTSGNYHVALLKPFASPMSAVVPSTHAAFTVGTSNLRPYGAAQPPYPALPFYRPTFDAPGVAAPLGEVSGRIGEGVRLGRLGYIEIAHHVAHTPGGALSLHSDSISIEAFVKPSNAFLQLQGTLPSNHRTKLFHHQDRITVYVTKNGSLSIDVPNLDALPLPPNPPVPNNFTSNPVLTQAAWYHVAITFGQEVIRCYVDGALIGQATLAGSALPVSSVNKFEVGPNGSVYGSDEVLFWVDEFRLSRLIRTAEEIARHAYVATDKVWATNDADLPPLAGTPLRSDDCRVDPSRPWTRKKSDFGAYAFLSKRLSVNQNFACASCHGLARSFTDGLAVGVGHAGGSMAFNTPTILNSVTSERVFWDMRSVHLADLATQPITTPIELGFTTLQPALNQLMADPTAVTLHAAAFGGSTIITKATLEQGLESYMQSLIVANTAVEAYEQGQTSALTAVEKRGRALFFGKARCVGCHSGPSYSDAGAHNTGVSTTGQFGQGYFSGRARDLGAFKTPTLRRTSDTISNSSRPYFHDGFAPSLTLAQIVDFYDLGGGQAGVATIAAGRTAIGTPDIELMRLALTASEKADLVAFLRRVGE